ncbi:1426_t:CDS:2, partial [Dentiscutata heterogama]
VQDPVLGEIRIIPMWKDKTIDSSLRTFVNATIATVYEISWANLKSISSIIRHGVNNPKEEGINWKNTWKVLKKLQGRSLYKDKTCIACCVKDETMEHLAECQVYQRIWNRIENTQKTDAQKKEKDYLGQDRKQRKAYTGLQSSF